MVTIINNKIDNIECAIAIKKFIEKHKVNRDSAIYVNNQRWSYDSRGILTIEDNMKATNYFSYANDETVSMSFEGGLYHLLNNTGAYSSNAKIKEFTKIVERFGFYYQFGDAWNLTLYEK